MRSTLIVAVALAMGLFFVPTFLVQTSNLSAIHQMATALVEAFQWRCDDSIGEDYCNYLESPIRRFIEEDFYYFVEDASYKLRRSSIPKNELPILRIYMSDGSIGKLHKKREIALQERFPYLLRGPDDWVKAKIISDDGNSQKMSRVKIRLKGDAQDHFDNSRKISFRIEVGSNQLIWGMSTFSIQRPGTRLYQNEALIMSMMRRAGIIAPRYSFVDVYINDQKIGVMALEEHFTKEMIEAQKRREGPMIALDENWYWQNLFLAMNRNVGSNPAFSVLGLKDYPIKVYGASKFGLETSRRQQKIAAMSLLRDEIDDRITGNVVFDMNLVSLWWVIASIWGAEHGMDNDDVRFYFNPITRRLEPVSFDNEPNPRAPYTRHLPLSRHNNVVWPRPWFVNEMLQNPIFTEITKENVKKINKLLTSEAFREWFISEQDQYLKLLQLDNILHIDPIEIIDLTKNLANFSNWMESFHWGKYWKKNTDPIHGRSTLESDTPLYTHLRPFLFWSADGAAIELKNLTLHPIAVHSVFFVKQPDNNFLQEKIALDVYQVGSTNHVRWLQINASEFGLDDQMRIRYSYRGQEYTRPVILQFRNYDSGYPSQEVTRAWFEKNGVLLNQATKTITFGPGNYSLETSLETEQGWLVELLPGAVLEFKQGARLKVNGPVQALGREGLLVQLMITSDPTRDLIGSWGGLLVVEANRKSLLRHTHVIGTTTHGFSERQDAHGLTGCITFYKSDVRIEHSRFSGLQCEDALNIISSDFNIDHVEFVDSSADAFDGDFSEGIVSNSVFHNIVNDGIDVSGSRVQISSSQFSNIQDKAISVGENSRLDANELTIYDADAGVVSKDKSVASLRNSSFKDVNNALMAYVKKEEWGPAEIHCDNCLFDHVESVSVEQYASRITIDGREVSPTPFSRKQLHIAGYVQ